MSIYSWPNMLFSVIVGTFVDKFGVQKMLTLSWIGNIIGLFTIIYSSFHQSYLVLCVGRVLVGISNEALSLTAKLYVIKFFKTNEYSIVFGIYMGFVTAGTSLTTISTFQLYKQFGIQYALSSPLMVAPFVLTPLFIFMFIEKYKSSQLAKKSNATESVTLIEGNTKNSTQQNKFKLSDMKTLPVAYWILLFGFIIWSGESQASSNIAVSFITHMFSASYQTSTFIRTYGLVLVSFFYLCTGIITLKYGRKMEMLLFAVFCAIIKNYINGWINNNIFYAFVSGTFGALAAGFTYPVVWAAISLLVNENVRGTAFGLATSTRFGVIAIFYVIVGILTRDEDGNKKYIDVQIFLIGADIISVIFYSISMFVDIKYNHSVLRKVHTKEQAIISPQKMQDIDLSMEKNLIVFGMISLIFYP
eukprot:393289_1